MHKCYLSTNLPILLKRKKMTLYKICSYTDLDMGTAYKWLRNPNRIPLCSKGLIQLSRKLGVSLNRMIYEDLSKNTMFVPEPLKLEIPQGHPAYEHELAKRDISND